MASQGTCNPWEYLTKMALGVCCFVDTRISPDRSNMKQRSRYSSWCILQAEYSAWCYTDLWPTDLVMRSTTHVPLLCNSLFYIRRVWYQDRMNITKHLVRGRDSLAEIRLLRECLSVQIAMERIWWQTPRAMRCVLKIYVVIVCMYHMWACVVILITLAW